MSRQSVACRATVIASLLAASGCTATRLPFPPVEHQGAMREMFESGSAAARVTLAPLLATPHLYALGPLEGLRGEILVWDGTPFTSCVDARAGGVQVAVDRSAKAPFLVWSHVKQWRDVAVPEAVRSLAELEAWLPKAASATGLAAREPFAFLLLGAVESATLHVDDLPADGTPLTHASHEAAQRRIGLANAPMQILGFFAPDAAGAKGIYTHHDSNVHLHLRTLLGTTMGHVDQLALAPGATLKLAWR